MVSTDKEVSPDSIASELFVTKEEDYGKEYKKHLLEQYKLYVEMVDRICSRRSNANTYFLSINTLLLTAVGVLSKLGPGFLTFHPWWIALTSFAGILFCWTWWNIIRSYLQLSTGKFQVVLTIEDRLPLAMYKAEWSYLKPKNRVSRYTELTKVERWVPIIFAAIYLVLIVIALVSANESWLTRLFS